MVYLVHMSIKDKTQDAVLPSTLACIVAIVIKLIQETDVGLDMYAYVASKAGQEHEYWNQYDLPDDQKTVEKPRELAYWRKHPNLHGWMNELWRRKNTDPSVDPMFNGVELELTWEDLDELEDAVESGNLPVTQGFFFGSDADDYYKQQDLEFIKNARSELFCGLRVFYNSSW